MFVACVASRAAGRRLGGRYREEEVDVHQRYISVYQFSLDMCWGLSDIYLALRLVHAAERTDF